VILLFFNGYDSTAVTTKTPPGFEAFFDCKNFRCHAVPVRFPESLEVAQETSPIIS
jgi:hypothetical protein